MQKEKCRAQKEIFYRNLVHEFETESHTWKREIVLGKKELSFGKHDIVISFHVPENVDTVGITIECPKSDTWYNYTWEEREEKLEDILLQCKTIPRLDIVNRNPLGHKRIDVFRPFIHGFAWCLYFTINGESTKNFCVEKLIYPKDMEFYLNPSLSKQTKQYMTESSMYIPPGINCDQNFSRDPTISRELSILSKTLDIKLKLLKVKNKTMNHIIDNDHSVYEIDHFTKRILSISLPQV